VRNRALLATAALLLAAGCAHPPGPAGAPVGEAPPGMVSVTVDEGAGSAAARPRASGEDRWLDVLANHLAERAAALLPRDQRLEVRLERVRRAGREDDGARVRQVGELHPPRIDLSFTLRSADGRVLREGRRELRNPAFQLRGTRYGGDPLRYEKALIDDWLAREFAAAAPKGAR